MQTLSDESEDRPIRYPDLEHRICRNRPPDGTSGRDTLERPYKQDAVHGIFALDKNGIVIWLVES